MFDKLGDERRAAVAFIITWLAQSPTNARLATVADHCNWQIEEVDELIGWIIRHPNCPAEAVLKLLDASGFWNPDEEDLRTDEAFHLLAEMMEGLRAKRYQWISEPRSKIKPFPFDVKIAEWRDIGEIDLIPLYNDIRSFSTPLPEEIKDVFETLGVGFGEGVARVARQLLIDKGYDPDDL